MEPVSRGDITPGRREALRLARDHGHGRRRVPRLGPGPGGPAGAGFRVGPRVQPPGGRRRGERKERMHYRRRPLRLPPRRPLTAAVSTIRLWPTRIVRMRTGPRLAGQLGFGACLDLI